MTEKSREEYAQDHVEWTRSYYGQESAERVAAIYAEGAGAMTDHIASADKKATTIIDRMCEALYRNGKSDWRDNRPRIIVEDAIIVIRRIAAAGATEGEIETIKRTIWDTGIEINDGITSDGDFCLMQAKAVINAMLGRE